MQKGAEPLKVAAPNPHRAAAPKAGPAKEELVLPMNLGPIHQQFPVPSTQPDLITLKKKPLLPVCQQLLVPRKSADPRAPMARLTPV